MARDLSTGVASAVAGQRGTLAYLFRIASSGGVIEIATTPFDLDVDVDDGSGVISWQGVGGTLLFESITESPDAAAQAVDLSLSGVDLSIIALILTNYVRGQSVTIWLVMLDEETGRVVDTPYPLFNGFQLSDYVITERRSRDGGTCDVKTRVQSRFAVLESPATIRTNMVSHNDALKRAGLATGDTFFQNTAAIKNKLIMWGPLVIGDPTSLIASIPKRFGF